MNDTFHNEFTVWFAELDRRSLANFHHFTREAGLTMLQMHLLMYLHSHGPCEMTALVEATHTSKGAISQMVDRLVQQRFVERAEAPDDRRAKQVTLTRKGQRIVEGSMRARQAWLEGASALLTDPQRQQVTDALRMLVEAATRAESASGTRKPRQSRSERAAKAAIDG
jgi:DNA-binding MarR family transcriptional regulator